MVLCMNPFTVASAVEFYDFAKLELIDAARAQLAAANHAFMQATRELLAARALGRPTVALFDELEVLYGAKSRAEEAFRVAHE
jgi:hypothetical protein